MSEAVVNKIADELDPQERTYMSRAVNGEYHDEKRWSDPKKITRIFPKLINSPSCCGAFELSFNKRNSIQETAATLRDSVPGGRLVVYFGVDSYYLDMLRSLGFKEITKFYNSNSGNNVTVLHYYKDWGNEYTEQDSDDDYQDDDDYDPD
jgi:hypothetical protein